MTWTKLWWKNSWKRLSSIDDETVINLQSTQVYVFSDSVLCLGRVLQHPESNEAWKNRVAGVRAERSYRGYDAINGESTEFEWNIFPGFTTLQLCDKINDLLCDVGQTPETFTGRILFVNVQRHSKFMNSRDRTLKHMFDITAKWWINCTKLLVGENSWRQLSLIGDATIINLQRTKVHVYYFGNVDGCDDESYRDVDEKMLVECRKRMTFFRCNNSIAQG